MNRSLAPSNKVTAGAIAGALSTIVVWLTPASEPAEVAVAITVVLTAVVQWFVKD